MTRASPILRPSLPYPFCGEAGSQCHAEEVTDNVWTVVCENCGANGPLDLSKANTASRAVGAWEARPVSQFDRDLSQALNEGDGVYRP